MKWFQVLNDIVGTYPNNMLGYFYRSLIVVEGRWVTDLEVRPFDACRRACVELDSNTEHKLL
jgi:hypothetical protein